jgi:hypothetical protein
VRYRDAKVANRNAGGFRGGGRSCGRFATRADFPLQDRSPYSHVHVRRESLGFVPRLLPGLCVVPPICIIAVAAPATALRRLSSLALIAGQLSLLRDCSAALDRRGGSYSCHGSDGQVAGSNSRRLPTASPLPTAAATTTPTSPNPICLDTGGELLRCLPFACARTSPERSGARGLLSGEALVHLDGVACVNARPR